MLEITILNYSLYSIRVLAYYIESLELIPTIKQTRFFGNGDFLTINISNNSRNISITIDILDEKGIAIAVRSFKFDNIITKNNEEVKKLLQFVGYKNLLDKKDYFFDIMEIPLNTNFSLKSFIKFENKTSSSFKCDIFFQIKSKAFKYESTLIKSKKNVNFYLPFNCNYVQLKIFRFTLLNNLELIKFFEFTNIPIKKCYTFSSNLFNTSFSIKENICS